jgi:hypothetical protein
LAQGEIYAVGAVSQVPDDIPGFSEGEDDALLLIRLDLREDIHFVNLLAQRLIAHPVHVYPGHERRAGAERLTGHVGHRPVATRDELE